MKDDEQLTSQQLDYRSGRTSIQATRALRLRDLRKYVAENPGQTNDEIFAATKLGGLMDLHRKKLIRFEGGGKKGPAKWFVVPQ